MVQFVTLVMCPSSVVTKVICFGWIANIAVIELLILSMKPNIHSFTCFLGPYKMDIA